MSIPPVNGEARRDIAVLSQRMDDCQVWSRERFAELAAEQKRQAECIGKLEDSVLVMTTRIGMWAAGGAALAGILVQIAFRLFA